MPEKKIQRGEKIVSLFLFLGKFFFCESISYLFPFFGPQGPSKTFPWDGNTIQSERKYYSRSEKDVLTSEVVSSVTSFYDVGK